VSGRRYPQTTGENVAKALISFVPAADAVITVLPSISVAAVITTRNPFLRMLLLEGLASPPLQLLNPIEDQAARRSIPSSP